MMPEMPVSALPEWVGKIAPDHSFLKTKPLMAWYLIARDGEITPREDLFSLINYERAYAHLPVLYNTDGHMSSVARVLEGQGYFLHTIQGIGYILYKQRYLPNEQVVFPRVHVSPTHTDFEFIQYIFNTGRLNSKGIIVPHLSNQEFDICNILYGNCNRFVDTEKIYMLLDSPIEDEAIRTVIHTCKGEIDRFNASSKTVKYSLGNHGRYTKAYMLSRIS